MTYQSPSTLTDICMCAHNSIRHDARVQKEAASLAGAGWRVIVIGIALTENDLPPVEDLDGFTIWRVMPSLPPWTTRTSWGKLLRLLVAIPLLIERIRASRARVFHAHDFPALVLMALAGIWRRPVIYDSHELFFDRWPPDSRYPLLPFLRMLRPLEKWLARRAAGVIVTSAEQGPEMMRRLGIAEPVLVYNAVDLREMEAARVTYPANGRRLIVHSGNLHVGRHLPELIESLRYLPEDIALVLMGSGPLQAPLTAQARALKVEHKLIILPPVPIKQVASTQAQADAALVLVTSSTLHFDLAMANKFFEAVAAGLPIVSSPTTAAAAFMRRYDLGLLVDPTDPPAIAQAIIAILEPAANAHYRANAVQARQSLNWQAEERKLIALYQRVMGE
jgi:glycosyltransferase involved in cell wall biosynthesis